MMDEEWRPRKRNLLFSDCSISSIGIERTIWDICRNI